MKPVICFSCRETSTSSIFAGKPCAPFRCLLSGDPRVGGRRSCRSGGFCLSQDRRRRCRCVVPIRLIWPTRTMAEKMFCLGEAAGILFPLEFSSVARCIYLRRVHGTRAWTSGPELEKEPSFNGLALKSISAQTSRHHLPLSGSLCIPSIISLLILAISSSLSIIFSISLLFQTLLY